MSEQTVTAYSKLSPTGAPHFGDCQLVMGDGTDKVTFLGGRAEVPMRLAKVVSKHPHIEIPALNPHADRANLPASASSASAAATPEALAAAQVRIAELEAKLLAQADAEQADADAAAEQEGAEVDEAIRLAQEHLREEGEDVPDPELDVAPAAPSPEGFEPLTPDNQPRCQAAKTDRSQCANAAVEGGYCNLPKHKALAAE